MYDLIKLTQQTLNDEVVNTVNARELHEFLGVKRDFSNWIKGRITKYQFEEERDYIIFEDLSSPNLANSKSRAQKLKEYQITLDMAKELAMVENNDRGREARRYFIQCEKELKTIISPKQVFLLNIMSAKDDLSRAIAINKYELGYVKPLEDKVTVQETTIKEQRNTLKEATPKVDFYDIAVASSSTIDIGEAAKILKYRGTGRNNLFKFLRREGVLMKNNAPKQEYVNKGWFKLVEYKVNGEVKIKTLVYQKGLDGIRKMLNEAGLLPEGR